MRKGAPSCSLPRRRPEGFVTQLFLPHRRLLIRALNPFPLFANISWRARAKNKNSHIFPYISPNFTILALKSSENYSLFKELTFLTRRKKTNSTFFLTNAMPTAFADHNVFYYRQPLINNRRIKQQYLGNNTTELIILSQKYC